MFDTIITNGSIIDGSGRKEYMADIGILEGRIAQIGNLGDAVSKVWIDATNKKVLPGFIDIHDHSDTMVLAGPMLDSYFMQGVTTVLSGQCGYSAAPVKSEQDIRNITDWLPEWSMKLTWSDFGSYLDEVEKAKPGINFACQIGHGALRTYVMGFENRLCTPRELEEMKVVLRQSIRQGAAGFSTGLEYMPGASASYDEILELCKIVAEEGQLYSTHQRDRNSKIKESMEEAISIARDSGVRMQISHTAPRWWAPEGTARMVLEMIEQVRNEGLEVNCDYIVTNRSICYLMSFLPTWAFNDGIERLGEYLNDPKKREEMKKYDDHIVGELVRRQAWDKITLSFCSKNKELMGMTFDEIGKLKNCHPHDAILDIIRDEKESYLNVAVLVEITSDETLSEIMVPEYSFPEPDVWGMSMFDKLAGNIMSGPSGYAWTPEYLNKFIKEKKVMSLEEGIRRLTSLPAAAMHLVDRGQLKEGMWADIVVLDYAALKSNSTFADPNHYPDGFEHIFINGVHVAKDGAPTGLRGGKVLRSVADTIA